MKKTLKITFTGEGVDEFYETRQLLYSKFDFAFNHSNKKNYYLFEKESYYARFDFNNLSFELSENGEIEILDDLSLREPGDFGYGLEDNDIINLILENYTLKTIKARGYSQRERIDFYFLFKNEDLKNQECLDLFNDLDDLKTYFTRCLVNGNFEIISKKGERTKSEYLNSYGIYLNEQYFENEKEKNDYIEEILTYNGYYLKNRDFNSIEIDDEIKFY